MNEKPALQDVFETIQTHVLPSLNQEALRETFLAEAQQLKMTAENRRANRQHFQWLFRRTTLYQEAKLKTLRLNWAAVAVMVLLIVGAVVAQQVLDLFRPTETDQTAIPVMFGSGARIIQPPQTLAEAAAQANFPVKMPLTVPEAYSLTEASYTAETRKLTIQYQCGSFRQLIFQQQPLSAEEFASLSKLDVGASAVIETIPIGQNMGQYARGTWIVKDDINALAATAIPGTPIPAHSVWENNSELQRLYWYDAGIFYALFNIGSQLDLGTAGECALNQEDFAAAANSLSPMP
ncbi:MAG TPA: hypothetical protein VHO69_10870 [Phototrophicaceae bacterium]|nr:hypothetical protein [Phototrophicaceae bacterium]